MDARRGRRRDPLPAAAHRRSLPRRRGRRLRAGRHRRVQRVPVGGVLRARPHPARRRGADALDRHRRRGRVPAPGRRLAGSRPSSCRTGPRVPSSSATTTSRSGPRRPRRGPGVHPHQRDLAGRPPAGPQGGSRGRRSRPLRRTASRRRGPGRGEPVGRVLDGAGGDRPAHLHRRVRALPGPAHRHDRDRRRLAAALPRADGRPLLAQPVVDRPAHRPSRRRPTGTRTCRPRSSATTTASATATRSASTT